MISLRHCNDDLSYRWKFVCGIGDQHASLADGAVAHHDTLDSLGREFHSDRSRGLLIFFLLLFILLHNSSSRWLNSKISSNCKDRRRRVSSIHSLASFTSHARTKRRERGIQIALLCSIVSSTVVLYRYIRCSTTGNYIAQSSCRFFFRFFPSLLFSGLITSHHYILHLRSEAICVCADLLAVLLPAELTCSI